MTTAPTFFDLTQFTHRTLFKKDTPVWSALTEIPHYLEQHVDGVIQATIRGKVSIGEKVSIGKGTSIEPGAVIEGPAWIGENCVIRSGCYIRGNVLTGNGVVLGHACEFKNSILFDEAAVPHFNYVGDSILGNRAHLGAGVILSNVRLDKKPITIITEGGEKIRTGLKKLGAIVGDDAEIGCNAVINPGSLIGKQSILYPGVQWRGALGDKKIVQLKQKHVIFERRT